MTDGSAPTSNIPSSNKITLTHFRDFYSKAWHSLQAKLAVGITIVITLVGTIFTLLAAWFGQPITSAVKFWVIIISSIIALTLLVITLWRGLTSVLIEWSGNRAHIKTLNNELAHWRESYESLSHEPKTPFNLWIYTKALYGISFNSLKCNLDVHADGSSLIQYELIIEANHEGIDSFERWTRSSQGLGLPNSNDIQEGKTWVCKATNGSSVLIDAEGVSRTSDTVFWKLRATPYFPVGAEIPFSYETPFGPGAFAMNYGEMLARNLRWEWFALRITYPTKNLRLSISLPADFIPKRHDMDVWTTERTQAKNEREYDRVRQVDVGWAAKLTSGGMQLLLNVNYPILGLAYALKWQPPDNWLL